MSQRIYLGLALAIGLAGSTFAQTTTSTATTTASQEPNLIEAGLKATGLNYAKTTSGLSYSVDFDHSGGKTRRVLVAITPTKLLKVRSHVIYTTVWVGDQAPSGEILAKVMYQPKKYGHFYTFKDTEGKYAVRFGVNFNSAILSSSPQSGEATVKNLKDCILFVDQVGEETSKQLSGQ